jgi:hypothetical protein
MSDVAVQTASDLHFGGCETAPTLEQPVSFAEPEKWRHHVITVSPAQRKAVERGALAEGLSIRAHVQSILSAWLRKPTLVQPVTAAPGRVRIKVNLSAKVYERLSEYAQAHNVTMTAVSYTAIARHLDI